MKKIIVVTRRENKFIETESSLGCIRDETVSKYDIYPVDKGDMLFEFWSNKLCKGFETLRNREELRRKFENLNNKFPQYFINIDYCLNIYKLKAIDIFIYHQWLDKQGLDDPFASLLDDLHFLSALKQDILRIKQNENEPYEFNWLIHDADLLSSYKYDGLIRFRNKNYRGIKIPDNLNPDNIWSFIHDTTSKYYKKYILDFFNNTNIQTVEGFYNSIAYEKDACMQRIELLHSLDLTDNSPVNISDKRFIFQNESWAELGKFKKNGEEFEIKTIKNIKDFLQ
jgi:hypothetical protein